MHGKIARIAPHVNAAMYVTDSEGHKVASAPTARVKRMMDYKSTNHHHHHHEAGERGGEGGGGGGGGGGGTHIAATVKNTVRRLLRRTKSHRDTPSTNSSTNASTMTAAVNGYVAPVCVPTARNKNCNDARRPQPSLPPPSDVYFRRYSRARVRLQVRNLAHKDVY